MVRGTKEIISKPHTMFIDKCPMTIEKDGGWEKQVSMY